MTKLILKIQLFCFVLICPILIHGQMTLQDKVVSDNRQVNGFFGANSVSIDGDYMVVGAHGEGKAYVYEWNNCSWDLFATLNHPTSTGGGEFGICVSISGNFIAVGAHKDDQYAIDAGNVFIFEIVGTLVNHVQTLQPLYGANISDAQAGGIFGRGVSIDDNTILVGAPGESQDINGLNPLSFAGAAYVYERTNSSSPFVFAAKLVANVDRSSADEFGRTVCVDGNNIAVGAVGQDYDASGTFSSYESGAGAVYTFQKTTGWNALNKIVASDREAEDNFGFSLDLNQDNLVIGAPHVDTDNSGNPLSLSAGRVYTYELSTNWGNEQILTNSYWTHDDRFGYATAIHGNTLIATAVGEEFDENGNNSIFNAGAAYVFEKIAGVWTQTSKMAAPALDRTAHDFYGNSVAMDADKSVIGAGSDDDDEDWLTAGNIVSNAGSAYAYGDINMPDLPTISSSVSSICAGSQSSVTLSIQSGNLNDATHWQWYEGSCGGTPIGTGMSLVVNPSNTTTYCVRGEGCFTPGNCQCITIDAHDGPNYNVPSALCENDPPVDITPPSIPINVCNIVITGTGAPGVTGQAFLNAALLGPGSYQLQICYRYCDGTECCTNYKFKIFSAPVVSLDPISNIDLCVWNGTNIQLNGTGNGSNCWYGGPGVNPTTGVFDPSIAGPGIHTLTYTCTDGMCTSTASQQVTITNQDHWHQTTEQTEGSEVKYDVVTDSDGNVYVTGAFNIETTFDGGSNAPITIASNDLSTTTYSFVAKYDKCGNLLWINNSKFLANGFWNYGKDLVLGQGEEYLYLAGNFKNEIAFYGPYGGSVPASTVATGANGEQGYVLRMSTNNGQMHYIDPVQFGNTTHLDAITIDENLGSIFVGGHHDGPYNVGEDRAFVQKFLPNGTGINSSIWTIDDYSDGDSYIHDLDFDETIGEGAVYIIGDYGVELTFYNGVSFGNSITNINGGLPDAFVCLYSDPGPVPNELFITNGLATNGAMTGTGISTNDFSGIAYITGTYENNIANVFGFGHNLGNNSTQNAYFGAIDQSGNSVWSNTQYCDAGNYNTIGVDVSYRNGNAYFAGMYTGECLFSGNSPISLAYSANPISNGLTHVFIVGYDAVTGNPIWANGTSDPNTNTSVHQVTAVTTDPFDHAFLVGGYQGDIGYILGNPSSGVLVSSGASVLHYNAFTMRSDLMQSGSLKNGQTSSAPQAIKKSTGETTLEVYPNPFTDMITIQLNDSEAVLYNVSVLSIDGRTVYKGSKTGQSTEINLNNLETGIYTIIVDIDDQQYVTQIVKTN